MIRSRTQLMEADLRRWWRVSLEANLVAHADPESPLLNDYRDEAEVIALYTSWPRLKEVIEYRTSIHDDVLDRIKRRSQRGAKTPALLCLPPAEVLNACEF